MIKEFCMACRGTGISGYYNSATSHKVIDCGDCQGKGYTELEPVWNGPANLFIVSEEQSVIQDRVFSTFKHIEVYIKELKE